MVYQTQRGIDKKNIAPFKYTAYENKSQDVILFDKEGGLEADLNSEWEKLPTANLSDFVLNSDLSAQEVVTYLQNNVSIKL